MNDKNTGQSGRRQTFNRQPPQIDRNRQPINRQVNKYQNPPQQRNRTQPNKNTSYSMNQNGPRKNEQRKNQQRRPQTMQQFPPHRQPQRNQQPQQPQIEIMQFDKNRNDNRQPTMGRRTQRKQKQHRLRKIFIRTFFTVFFILLLGVGGAFAAFKYYTKDMTRQVVDEEVLSVNTEKQVQSVEMKIKNIAVFGVDSRNGEDAGNSDAIMIVSIDGNRGKVKMISIARDTYVKLPNDGRTKITHAYSYGGPEMAMATLNENFGMDITDYITVNFEQLAQIIEEMGGIDVEINEGERQEMNRYVAAGVEKVQETGMVHLNGEQAVSYSRIRKNDNDDMRTGRQRKVMMCLFEKAKEISPMRYPYYVKLLMPMMETSLTDSEILQLAPVAMNKNLVLEQDSFPNDYIHADGSKITMEVEKVPLWVYQYDLEQASDMINKFIYDDIPFSEYK